MVAAVMAVAAASLETLQTAAEAVVLRSIVPEEPTKCCSVEAGRCLQPERHSKPPVAG